jgi:starch-binding outer membrane protein, SusD/RagB family
MNYNKLFRNRYLLIILAAGSVLGSCSKSFVDKSPLTSFPTTDALNSPLTLQNALNGLYAEIRNVSQYGRDWPVLGDLQADNTFIELMNTNRYINEFGYDIPITDQFAQDMWAESYTGILRANQIIDAPVTGVDAIKAQAYAIRALIYFKLVNIYSQPYTLDTTSMGVPLVLHYDPTLTPGRSSVGTVYNQIVSDLTTALKTTVKYTSSVYLSQYSIEALLARTYLYMGDYSDALARATDVINKGGFSLVTAGSFNDFWSNPGPHTDHVEVLFEVDNDPVNNNGFDDLGGIYLHGYQDIYCANELAALYSPTDVRGTLLTPGLTKDGDPAFLVLKYPNTASNDKDNIKVIRLSEVYLIAAEAAARTGTGDPLGSVNAVAIARDPSFTGYTDLGPQLITDIIQERRKELAFEGDRFYDLNRLGLTITRESNSSSIPVGDGLTIPFPNNARVFPIPQQEILRNANIKQNPGYGN